MPTLVTVSFARSKNLIEDLNDLNGYIPYEEQKRQLKHANYSIFRTKQKIVEYLPDLVSFRLYSGQYLERWIFLRLLMKFLGLPRMTMPRFPQVFNE